MVAKGDYELGLIKFEESSAIYKSINYKTFIGSTLLNIADVYLQQKNYKKAEAKFNECLTYESSFLDRGYADLYYKMGDLYQKLKNKPLAQSYFEKSLQISTKYDYKEISQKGYYQLFLLALDKHENDKALSYLDISNRLNDSLYNEDKTRRIAEMELKFDTEKRENEIHSLKLRENRLLLIGSLALFLMVLVFLSYTIQLRGRNYKALKAKNFEIEQQYRRLEESNEILSQFA